MADVGGIVGATLGQVETDGVVQGWRSDRCGHGFEGAPRAVRQPGVSERDDPCRIETVQSGPCADADLVLRNTKRFVSVLYRHS